MGPIPQADWELFATYLQQRCFSKKTVILQPGMVENHLSFIESGITRHYTEQGEKEITFDIGFENTFGTAYDSFLTRQPCTYFVAALTDVVQWSIQYDHLQEIYLRTSVGQKIGRLSAEEQFVRKSKRQISLLKDTAEQRYLGLFTDYPHLLQHIPLKYLASYIGITPQALSRIRKRIS
ncbi:Crp/Fnr family transcriptional regulator [Deminuibacter soli]|nr:Crp/Fnr family transcriptional regulator [Deminuibacter soli]